MYTLKKITLWTCLLLHFSLAYAQPECKQLRLVDTRTADNLISNAFVAEIFNHLGHEVERVRADSSQEAYMLLSDNEADIYLSTWIPLDIENLKGYALNGRVKTLNPILTDAKMGLSTNQFGQQAGLQHFDQIADLGEVLDYTIYVGQHNWMFAQRMQSVIDSNIYGLSNFQVKRLHNFDFNAYLEAAEAQQKPVVFFTRQPSFIANKFAAGFLLDSQHFFENYQTPSTVYVSVRYDFPETCKKAAERLTRFSLSATQHTEIIESAKGDRFKLVVAVEDFLKSHQSLLSSWLGKPLND